MPAECNCIRTEGYVNLCGPCQTRERHYQAGYLDGWRDGAAAGTDSHRAIIVAARELLDALESDACNTPEGLMLAKEKHLALRKLVGDG